MSGENRDEIALQLCTAEYQAMMAKVHSWISLQFTIVSLVLVTLTILAQLWPRVPFVHLAWLAAVVIGLAGIYYLNVKLDGLRAVLYVEQNLRPRAAALLQSQNVFMWEHFLKRLRPAKNPSESVNNPPLIVVLVYFVFDQTRQGKRLWKDIDAAVDRPTPPTP
jgi:FtsH-binding integral membrane protein